MKRWLLSSCIVLLCTAGCGSLQDESTRNIKDLDENMIDLRMYHENLGDAIVKRDKDDAEWPIPSSPGNAMDVTGTGT